MANRALLIGVNKYKIAGADLSGCVNDVTNMRDIGGSYNGAFTYYTCKHIRDNQGNLSRAELIKRVRASLKFNGFSQIPQLEAPAAEKKKKILE